MISRRRILSKSRDDLTSELPYQPEEEEDVWTQKDKLFKVRIIQINKNFSSRRYRFDSKFEKKKGEENQWNRKQ